jgi:hypothetical protein
VALTKAVQAATAPDRTASEQVLHDVRTLESRHAKHAEHYRSKFEL